MLNTLRLFDLRLRLALDMEVQFKGETTLTKTKEVRDTYAAFLKLMELWNAYEALQHFAKEIGKSEYVTGSKCKAHWEAAGSMQVLSDALRTLKEKYRKEKKFKNDFGAFIEKIGENEHIKQPLKKSCESIKNYFDNPDDGKAPTGDALISLIYVQRNLYLHEAEAAKMGMSYPSAQHLISVLTDAFAQHLLLLSSSILAAAHSEGNES